MGEIADAMINGECCALCGQYFVKKGTEDRDEAIIFEHGYPVACNECYEDDCGYEKQSKQAVIL